MRGQARVGQKARTEEALRESEARLKGIIGSATDAIITINESQRVVLFNDAAERLFRCSASQAIGQPLDRFIPERFRGRHGDFIRAFGATGVSTRAMGAERVLAALRTDGEEFPMEAQISQVTVGGQKLYTVIIRDITERKRAEEVLRESEARFKGIISSATDAIISIDAEHKITIFNAGAEAIFGYPAEKMVGQPLDRLIPERFREAHRQHIDAFGATGISMRAMGGERVLTGLRRNGEEFPMEARISQIELGEHKLYTVILRDISERKRSEAERERLLAEAERAGADAERAAEELRRIQTITDAALAHLAIDDLLRELLGRIREVLRADTAVVLLLDQTARELVARAVSGLEGKVDRGLRIPVDKGFAGRIAGERRSSTLKDAGLAEVPNRLLQQRGIQSMLGVALLVEGRVVGVLHVGSFGQRCFTTEETELLRLVADRVALAIEHARLYEAEQRARAEAEAANRAKDEFLSVVSHELRTPLAAILGWVRVLRSGEADEHRSPRWRRIERNARVQAKLIEDLLDVSRIVTGRMCLDLPTGRPCADRPGGRSTRCVPPPTPRAYSSRIALEPDASAGSPAIPIASSRSRGTSSATRSSSRPAAGGVEVRLGTGRHASALMIVRDTGTGIAPDFLPYIFDRFRQAERAADTRARRPRPRARHRAPPGRAARRQRQRGERRRGHRRHLHGLASAESLRPECAARGADRRSRRRVDSPSAPRRRACARRRR